MSQVFIEVFNKKTDEFFKDLVAAFPAVTQFGTFKAGFQLMKNINERRPQQLFHKYIYEKYGEQIKNKDEQFFMVTDLTNTGLQSTSGENWGLFVDNLRGIWKTMDAENKKVIWDYLNLLVKLNEKIVEITAGNA
jgi:hypothetical protein